QVVSLTLDNALHFIPGKFPRTRPDQHGFFIEVEYSIVRKMIDEVTEVGVNLFNRQWIPLKIQALIDDGEFNELFQTFVKFFGTFPADNEAIDTSRFCPLDMLAHHFGIVAGIMTE